MRARAEKNGYKNGTKFGSLTSQIKYDPRAQEMLYPTPVTRDYKGISIKESKHRRGLMDEEGSTLPDVIDRMVRDNLLPTPRANKVDACNLDNPKLANRNKSNLEEEVAKMVQTHSKTSADRGGKSFQLSPLFTEEMMGFPLMWTALPFLSESGAPKPSKPTETR